MDIATVLGMIIAFGMVLFGILMGGSILIFVDAPSFLIVFGGMIGASLINYPLSYVLGVMSFSKKTLFATPPDLPALRQELVTLSDKARKEGILSLESTINGLDNIIEKKGLQLAADGMDPDNIREILELEISTLEGRHQIGIELLQAFGTIAPAMGMIGTIIGLVQMLQSMSDPSSIGPAMAVALITTFYGALLANLIFNPLAGKLKTRSKEEIISYELVIEGVISIAKGENPRIMSEKLDCFIAPSKRVKD